MLRPETRGFYDSDVNDLRTRFGRFILINTNFSFYNSWFEDKVGGILKIGARTGAFTPGNDADMQVLQTIYTFEKTMFRAYGALLPVLSKAFPDHTIILRPHPIEKLERWNEFTAGLPNVKIIHEGGVAPWILAADAVVQTGCTTGFESLALGRPTLSYCPFDSPVVAWHLANVVCPRASDDAALVDYLKRFVSDPAVFAPFRAEGMRGLAPHVAGLSGETASAAIVRALSALADAHEAHRGPLARTFTVDQGLADYPRSDYLALKFPPLSLADMNDMISRFAAMDPTLGNVTATQIAESCFLLQRNA